MRESAARGGASVMPGLANPTETAKAAGKDRELAVHPDRRHTNR